MARVIRVVLSVLAGMTLAGGLVVAVELLSAVVHPTPPGFTGTQQEMCEHVARYPQWVLAVVVVAWSATALASTWLATRLGRRIPGAVVGLVLVSAVAFNVSMLPYPTWFKVSVLICIPIACCCGVFLPPASTSQPSAGPSRSGGMS
jgi:MFS family permease